MTLLNWYRLGGLPFVTRLDLRGLLSVWPSALASGPRDSSGLSAGLLGWHVTGSPSPVPLGWHVTGSPSPVFLVGFSMCTLGTVVGTRPAGPSSFTVGIVLAKPSVFPQFELLSLLDVRLVEEVSGVTISSSAVSVGRG